MIFMGDGRTEKGHHPVSGELVDGPLIAVDLIHEDLETPVHDSVHVLGVQFFRKRSKAGHIGKHDGDDFPLPFDGASGGQNFFGEVFRGVGFGGGVINLRRFGRVWLCWPDEIAAAFATEFIPGGLFSGNPDKSVKALFRIRRRTSLLPGFQIGIWDTACCIPPGEVKCKN